MRNARKLLEHVKESASCFTTYKQRKLIFKGEIFDGYEFNKFLSNVKFVVNKMSFSELYLDFYYKKVADDSIIVNLEIIIAMLFESGINTIFIDFKKLDINDSKIGYLGNSIISKCGKILRKNKFLDEYYSEFTIFRNTLRYYIKDKTRNEKMNSRILYDIITWVIADKNIDRKIIGNFAKAVVEIADNMRHSDSDCIVSIKSNPLINVVDRKTYYSLSVCVVNIGDIFIYTPLENSIKNNNLIGSTKNIVEKAMPIHEKFYNENYNLDRFCMVTVFQNSVTTNNVNDYGGNGLPYFIKVLIENSNFNNCYLISGSNVLFFKEHYISLNNGVVSFNKECCYYDKPPDPEVFKDAPTFYPGTMYNLEFIIKENI